MKRFLDKLRGAPEILATVIASFFALVIAVVFLLLYPGYRTKEYRLAP